MLKGIFILYNLVVAGKRDPESITAPVRAGKKVPAPRAAAAAGPAPNRTGKAPLRGRFKAGTTGSCSTY